MLNNSCPLMWKLGRHSMSWHGHHSLLCVLEKTLWDPFSAHLAHLQHFSGVTPHQGGTEPGSEVLLGIRCSLGDSSTFTKQIPPPVVAKYFLCVFGIVCSSLKHTQLLVFMFPYYCIICLGKSCCFIHLQVLHVNSLNFYIPP